MKEISGKYFTPFLNELETACIFNGDLTSTLENAAMTHFRFAAGNPSVYGLYLGVMTGPTESEAAEIFMPVVETQYSIIETMFRSAENAHGNMLAAVTRRGGSELLLAHNTVWPERRMSVPAGFLQPGESLEECVRREITEEIGIKISSPVYTGTQPWPFPSSLMAGFTAEWISGDIRVDGKEIDRAEWINAEQIAAARDWTAPDAAEAALQIPAKGSLSRLLIDGWASSPQHRRQKPTV